MLTLTSLDTPEIDVPFINAADGKVYVAVKARSVGCNDNDCVLTTNSISCTSAPQCYMDAVDGTEISLIFKDCRG